jgi:metal iron transporter
MEMDQFAEVPSSSRTARFDRVESQIEDEGMVKERDVVQNEPYQGNESDDKGYEIALKKYEQDVRSFDRISWVDIHILHSTVSLPHEILSSPNKHIWQIDTSISLLGFALTINAAILTVAGAAYFYNPGYEDSDSSLGGAHQLLKDYVGKAASLIFALALLCVSPRTKHRRHGTDWI